MERRRTSVAIVGAGGWGTALAKLLSDKEVLVDMWVRRPELAEEIRQGRENRVYLPGCLLNDNVRFSTALSDTVRDREIIVMAVPSHVYREIFIRTLPAVASESIIVSATKGIENETLKTMTSIMEEELNKVGKKCRLAVLSGPSFAREVAKGLPTAVTVASTNKDVAMKVQDLFFTDKFRVYANSDVIGVELGGPLKNIVAIAAGICDGLGYGTNARAALITRGLAEMTRMGVKMGANPHTFAGLAGLGDLVLTCTGELSRNRMVGLKLGLGHNLEAILREMNMVAEGVKTAKSAWQLAQQLKVEMPILEQVYQVLYEKKSCFSAVQSLMSRDQKMETDFLDH